MHHRVGSTWLTVIALGCLPPACGDDSSGSYPPTVKPLQEVAPWESTPENTPLSSMAPGYVPAWRLKPPRPDPRAGDVGRKIEPPDPASDQPPIEDPNGTQDDSPEPGPVGGER